jgi:hypothetical protein
LYWDFTKARGYGSQEGRFWQVDPRANEQEQEKLTPFHYAENNPIRYNDPTGECKDCIEAAEAVADFFNGVANAFSSNATTLVSADGKESISAINREVPNTTAYANGQAMGDALSVFMGTFEAAAGMFIAAGGTAVSSSGAGTIVGAPAVGLATGLIAHGVSTAKNGFNEMLQSSGNIRANRQKGKVKEQEVKKGLEKELKSEEELLEQATFKLPDGSHTRPDFTVVNKTNKKVVNVVDSKAGNAQKSKNQKKFEKTGGTLTGKNAKSYSGTSVPPTEIEVR